MKKRILSLLLCFSLLFGVAVPAMTPQADAIIGTIIKTGVKMSASIIKSCVNVCKNQHSYDNVGQAVGTLFKDAAMDFIGMGGSSGGGSGEGGGTTTTTIIQKVDLSLVESSLSDINGTLVKQNEAIYQLESTVTQGVQNLSDQLSVINNKIDQMKDQLTNSTQLLQYYTYLNTFFDFYNEYYEALSYYDQEMNLMLSSGGYSTADQKNLFDRFYQLSDVEYTGNFHSAVDKLGRYLQGNYLTSSPGSVVDVLSQYYITYYKLLGESDPKIKAAQDTEDMIGYLYYAYVMGVYYEQAIAMYQSAVITETGASYKTDFGTVLPQTSIDTTVETLWVTAQSTVGCILRDLIQNYPTNSPMPVVYQLSTGELLNRNISTDLFIGSTPSGVFHVECGATLTLQDPVDALSNFGTIGSGYFSKDFCEAFTDLALYQDITANDGAVLVTSLDGTTVQVDSDYFTTRYLLQAKMGNTAVLSIPVSTPASQDFYAGDGTADYPYLIKDGTTTNSVLYQLQILFGDTELGFDKDNSEYANCHFVLGQDVDMKGKKYAGLEKFSGSFDGNGYTIKNFVFGTDNITSDDDSWIQTTRSTGLFGELTGTVRNLNVEKCTFLAYLKAKENKADTSTRYAGVLAGHVHDGGKVEYCQVKNSSVLLKIRNEEGDRSIDEKRNLIAGGAVGCVGNKGSLDTVVVIDTSVNVVTTAVAGLGEYGRAYAGGLAGALTGSGTITHCSYNQTENFKGAAGSTDFKLYAESKNYAATGGLVGWSEATSVDQTSYCWILLADYPVVTGPNGHDSNDGIGHRIHDDIYPLFVYKNRQYAPNDVNQSSLSIKVITEYYKRHSMDANLNMTPFLETDNDILELHFRTSIDGTDLVTPHTQLTYAPSSYMNFSGFKVYQSVGRKNLGTEYKYSIPYYPISISGRVRDKFLVSNPLTSATQITFYYQSTGGSDTAGSVSTQTADLTIQEHPHIFVTKTLKAATCTEAGTKQNTCLICGKQEAEVIVEPLGHSMVSTSDAKAPTCTEPGHTAAQKCLHCDYTVDEAEIDALTHDYHPVVTAPTCTEQGYTTYTCTRCGDSYVDDYVDATGHSDPTELVTILDASCISGGVQQEKCTICGEVIGLKNLTALGHDYQAVVTAPDCETPGYTTHTCTRCGDSYTDSYTAPTNHTYGEGTVTKEPTCTEEGEMTYTCSCGESHTEPIPKLSHDYAPTVTDPTCTEMGYTTHTCTVCGDSYKDTYTMAAGHSWDDGETVTQPTLISKGLLRQTCTVCGETKDTVLPALTSCDGGMDCPSLKFTDVAGHKHWSHVGIDYVLRQGLFLGTSDTTFSPNAAMTRAMLVTVLYRMSGSPSVDGKTHPFMDVADHAWYESALIWAVSNGVVNGVSETEFAPNSNVTRQQVATILYRYAKLQGYDVSATTDLSGFPDYEKVASYATSAMAWANAAELVQGSLQGNETLLLPTTSATRAQLAAILMRFMKAYVQ